ncbi:MAG: hypothetical protein AAF945_21420, partial [Actinomycetota bacterium]
MRCSGSGSGSGSDAQPPSAEHHQCGSSLLELARPYGRTVPELPFDLASLATAIERERVARG